eukprot:scaffold43716_cov69-Phaeocystis_antarctica.AAC.1
MSSQLARRVLVRRLSIPHGRRPLAWPCRAARPRRGRPPRRAPQPVCTPPASQRRRWRPHPAAPPHVRCGWLAVRRSWPSRVVQPCSLRMCSPARAARTRHRGARRSLPVWVGESNMARESAPGGWFNVVVHIRILISDVKYVTALPFRKVR